MTNTTAFNLAASIRQAIAEDGDEYLGVLRVVVQAIADHCAIPQRVAAIVTREGAERIRCECLKPTILQH